MYLGLQFIFVIVNGPYEHPEHLVDDLGEVIEQNLILDAVGKIGVDQEPYHTSCLHE